LNETVEIILQRLFDSAIDQIAVEGPTVPLELEVAQALGFALHELAVNAKKFGALSVPSGRVTIRWRRQPPPQGDSVELRWVESEGPVVSAPVHRGFGSDIIERHLAHATNGEVQLSFPKEGWFAPSIFRLANSWVLRRTAAKVASDFRAERV
jgi:two-component sensor histidine kinase